MKRLRLLMALLIAVTAVPSARADEEFDALEREFNDAQQAWHEQLDKAPKKDGIHDTTTMPPDPAETFAPRFKAYAEKHAGEPEAIPALAWIVNNADGPPGPGGDDESPAKWAVERLTRNHAASPALATHLPRLRYAGYYIGDKPLIDLYERVIETNKDQDAAAWATFNLGYTYYEKMPHPSGKTNKSDKPRATDFFRRAVKDYAGTRAAERAAAYIYQIEHLQIGMNAPEIVGTGVDRKEIKLSQLRGQVVVLDFWGFW